MSPLDEILHYLDTTSRVSCPSITCEQAAEIAAELRGINQAFDIETWHYSHFEDVACGFAWDCGREMAWRDVVLDKQHRLDFAARMAKEKNDDATLKELIQASADVRGVPVLRLADAIALHFAVTDLHDGKTAREFRESVEAIGDIDPGGEDQTRVALVVDGRVEAIGDTDQVLAWINAYNREKESNVTLMKERDELKLKLSETETNARENTKYWMSQIDAVKATGDIDPGIYEGTGKGFGK